MALLTARSHTLRSGNWAFNGKKIDFQNSSDVVAQLRSAQSLARQQLSAFVPSRMGGVLDAEYRVAVAPFGRPKYFEYLVLSPDGGYWCAINGLVGYSGDKEAASGMVVVAAQGREIVGECRFARHRAVMKTSGIDEPMECGWDEGDANAEADKGVVTTASIPGGVELCQIQGQSKARELEGAVLKHQIISKGQLLADVYPEGKWSLRPIEIWKRLAKDTVRLLDYSEAFGAFVATQRGEESILVALAASLALHRRILHSGNPP